MNRDPAFESLLLDTVRAGDEHARDTNDLSIMEGMSSVLTYFDRYEAAKGELEKTERNRLDDAFDRVRDLQNYPFNVVELDSEVDSELDAGVVGVQ